MRESQSLLFLKCIQRSGKRGKDDTTPPFMLIKMKCIKKKEKKREPFLFFGNLIMHTRVCLNDVILDAHSHLCVTPRTNILIPNSNSLRQSAGYATKRILSKKKSDCQLHNKFRFFLSFLCNGEERKNGAFRFNKRFY